MVLNIDIYESFASSIKNFKDNTMRNFNFEKKIKEIKYETYLRLTPSYCAVILD